MNNQTLNEKIYHALRNEMKFPEKVLFDIKSQFTTTAISKQKTKEYMKKELKHILSNNKIEFNETQFQECINETVFHVGKDVYMWEKSENDTYWISKMYDY